MNEKMDLHLGRWTLEIHPHKNFVRLNTNILFFIPAKSVGPTSYGLYDGFNSQVKVD
jgi:hypothetical protein